MKTQIRSVLVLATLSLALLLAGCEALNTGLGSLLNTSGGQGGLTLDTIVAGLKEALQVGTQNTVAQTSKQGGFNLNPRLHIPLPQELQTVANTLKKVGLGSIATDLEAKMNEAAEQAAAKAAPVFIGAIKQMTFEDAKNILAGKENAATEYFREKTGAQLKELFKPIVTKATDQVGAAKAYKGVMDKYNAIPLVPKAQAASLDDYVTDKGIQGLFLVLADEEAKIRKDPAARTTELLRRVFGQ